MTKRMLIDAAHAEETRVVIIDGNHLADFDYETTTKKQIKGNIYLAKITRVEPSLQAAFVEFGGNRHGFLAFNEIHPDYYRIPVEDREKLIAERRRHGEGDDGDEDGSGSAEAGENLTGEGDELEEIGDAQRQRLRSFSRHYKIQEVVKRRQIMLVQVVKEERGNKGAALTTFLSLPGRYCVLMPNTARGGGISRKIANPAHRKKLREILSDLDVPEGMAVIMRTAGVERSKAEVKRDYEYLRRLWDEIREATMKATAPALIYEEGDVVKRTLRDVYTRDIEEVLVDGDEAYKTARGLMKTMMPSHAKRVKKYTDTDVPLFHRYKIEGQLDAIHEQVVTLRSGGYVVFNQTEALVAIDVNSGRATRERNIEQTALKTNLEAADEVARQLRLRDLAGLVVIDFIDMDDSRNDAAVERRLKEAMKQDRARLQVGRISTFGLLELSRQRLRPSVVEASSEVCPTCRGSGHVRSTESTALRVLRAIDEEGIRGRAAAINVMVPPAVAIYVLNHKRHALGLIEQRYNCTVTVGSDDELVPPAYRMETVRGEFRPAVEGEAPAAVGEEVEVPREATPREERRDDRSDWRRDGRGERREGRGERGESRGERPEGRREPRGEDERDEDRSEERPGERREARDGARDVPREDGGRRRRRRRRRRDDDGTRTPREATASSEDIEDGEEGAVEGHDAAEGTDDDGDEATRPAPRRAAEEEGDDGAPARRRRGRRGGRRRRRDGERGNGDDTDHETRPASLGSADDAGDEFSGYTSSLPPAPFDAEPESEEESVERTASWAVEPASSDTDEGPVKTASVEVVIEPASEPLPAATADVEITPPAKSEPAPEPVPSGPPRRGWWNRLTS
ncbi:MAG: Rne/Rng family ribonuclease [Alphaproteobacteria bacterium]|nr:Rne/Rng family ribonuclease [Alphaproteobacteria bacterium]